MGVGLKAVVAFYQPEPQAILIQSLSQIIIHGVQNARIERDFVAAGGGIHDETIVAAELGQALAEHGHLK